ncbi:MAG: heavy metal translocating P-type ATPase metal-binding domain-containing protein [Flavobacteriaceae bacterium]
MKKQQCYHCGNYGNEKAVIFNDLTFCCQGCKSIYRLLNSMDLDNYYALEINPGNKPEISRARYQNWDDEN